MTGVVVTSSIPLPRKTPQKEINYTALRQSVCETTDQWFPYLGCGRRQCELLGPSQLEQKCAYWICVTGSLHVVASMLVRLQPRTPL
jgi:hypothetical protein